MLESLAQAAVFMPIVTRQYFDRQNCRDELLTFHNEAKRLGVQSLVLPVVVLGHSYLTGNTTDPAARIISDRQFKDFRDAWIEGPESAVWRRELVQLANDLVTVVEAAERTLSATPNGGVTTVSPPEDRPGSMELEEAAERMTAELEPIAERMRVTLEQLAKVFTDRIADIQSPDAAQARQVVREVAVEVEPLGREFEAQGAQLQQLIIDVDAVLRGFVAQLLEAGTPEEIQEGRSSLAEARGELASLQEVQDAVATFLERIRPLELASAPMRAAFRPVRAGVGSVATAINLIRHWPDILDAA